MFLLVVILLVALVWFFISFVLFCLFCPTPQEAVLTRGRRGAQRSMGFLRPDPHHPLRSSSFGSHLKLVRDGAGRSFSLHREAPLLGLEL